MRSFFTVICAAALWAGFGQQVSRAAEPPPAETTSLQVAKDDLTLKSDDASYDASYDPEKLYVIARLGVWGTSLNGHAGVGPLSTGVNASFSDILDQTNVAVFPSFTLTKGNWLMAINGVYANLGDDVHIDGPLGFGRGADVTSNIGIADVAIGYTIARGKLTTGQPFSLSPAIGGRITSIDAEINPEDFDSVSNSRTWFDPYVGATITIGLTPKLDWRTAGTVGGFGVGSQFTWTAETMLEWHFSKHVGFDIGYRALAWEYDLNGFQWDMTMQGPWIGLFFNN